MPETEQTVHVRVTLGFTFTRSTHVEVVDTGYALADWNDMGEGERERVIRDSYEHVLEKQDAGNVEVITPGAVDR